jgi:large subunit ribosomal protein L4
MKLTIRDLKGNERGELEVKFPLVEDPKKGRQAVHDYVVGFLSWRRAGTACTKTMGEVAGTGKKPWRQKGTGRARAGSFASPLWRGGGVTFGPKPRDFSKKVIRGVRRLAFRKAMTERLNAGDVIIVEDFAMPTHKTRDFVQVMRALQLEGTVMLVGKGMDTNLLAASHNVPKVEHVSSETLNAYHVLKCDRLVFSREAYEQVEQRLNMS